MPQPKRSKDHTITADLLRDLSTEEEYQQLIIGTAELFGWMVYHTKDSRGSQPGFPDLVLVRAGTVLFLEVKTAKGRVGPHQALWIEALRTLSQGAAQVVRPRDWEVLENILMAPHDQKSIPGESDSTAQYQGSGGVLLMLPKGS